MSSPIAQVRADVTRADVTRTITIEKFTVTFILRMLFGMIRIRISDPRSLVSWCIKGANESTLDKDPSVLLMHHDPSDLGSLTLIWIILNEHTLNFFH